MGITKTRIGAGIFLFLLLLASMASMTTPAKADVVVIVAANAPVNGLSAAQVADIFLSKSGTFPDGAAVVPIDQADGSAIRNEFYAKAIGKTPELLKAYWSKMIFTGQAEPPREIADSEKIKKLIANNPHYIGYIDRNSVDASVKVVMIVH
jgi:ABC-type phosphate transport system substrate-binding protein